jgi:hypothetical protein
MAGSAILGNNLVDSLVPDVIDGIRDDLHPQLGVRQFRVFAVTRTYADFFGSENFTDAELEFTPQPLVANYTTFTTIRYELEPCGLDEAGMVILKEISLTYTEAEIAGPPSDPTMEDFLIRIQDAHGQAIPDRYFQPAGPPYPDRIQGMGWAMKLIPASTPVP